MGQANFPVLGPLKPQKHMIWCTYIGKTFCQVWTDHKLVNTTQKLQFGVMVTEQSFWDKKLPLFVESPRVPTCTLLLRPTNNVVETGR